MEAIISGINWLDDFIWGMPMIVLLLGTHLFMTVRTGFIQRKTLPVSVCPCARTQTPPAT